MQINAPEEYSILGLLKLQPMHGYEMFQRLDNGTLGQIIRLEMSQMYGLLKKLEKLGYIETTQETLGSRPPRKIHSLTPTGDAVLQAWLTQPVEKPRDIRMLFLLKLYFVQKFLPHKLDALIEQEIAACTSFLHHLESQRRESSDDDDAFFDHVVLRSRIHQTRALLEWMHELRKD